MSGAQKLACWVAGAGLGWAAAYGLLLLASTHPVAAMFLASNGAAFFAGLWWRDRNGGRQP